MAWIQIKPANQGGGRTPSAPTAKLYASGQFTLSHAAVALLGQPDSVLVSIEPDLKRIRIMPTTPGNQGAFSLAGGGNSPHRIGLKAVANKYEQLIAEYTVVKIAGGIECRQVGDRTP